MPRSAKSSELIMSALPARVECTTDPRLLAERSAVADGLQEIRGIELERPDSVAKRGPLVAQELALLALEQELAHAFFDDEPDPAPGLGVLLELAIRACGGERVHDEVASELADGGQHLAFTVGVVEDPRDDLLHELAVNRLVLVPGLRVVRHL